MLMLLVMINLIALNLLMLFLKLNKRHQSLIVCTIWWKRSWLPLRTLKSYRFLHLHQIHGPIDTVQNIWMFHNTLCKLQGNLKRWILAKPAQKQGKVISQNTTDLVLSMYKDNEFSCQMPGKKDYVSIAKGVHKQKRLVLCNLKEMYAAFKEKYLNVKLGFSKFCTFRPKWCVLAGSSGTHSVCVCSIHQNAILLVDAINWDITYKDLILK